QHGVTVHRSEYECAKCKSGFLTQTALEDHYRGKPSVVHPNCDRCGKGFLDQEHLVKHHDEAHPTTSCCGQKLYVDDLAEHYKGSANHPSCIVCGEGFLDDGTYDLHGAAEHPDSRCTDCKRQFSSIEDLMIHFAASPSHPKCSTCKLGFQNEDQFAYVGVRPH
ncbi:hypothetical protein DFH07DRAFT_755893, partial [Mycena maculata]